MHRSPLARTGFKRKQGGAFSSFKQSKPFTASGSLKKKSRKRPTVAEGSKYLAACRGEPCYLNVLCPWTDWADPTVVPCHSNQSIHGKGGNIKAEHRFSVPGCRLCHYWLDFGPAPYELKVEKFDSALARWVARRDRKLGIVQQDGEIALVVGQ